MHKLKSPHFSSITSITKVGMANLLPGASSNFRLKKIESGFVPDINGQAIGNVTENGSNSKEIW